MFEQSDSVIWMLADSSLPTGGFVASAALEVAIQTKHITNAKSLREFLSHNIHTFAHSAGITATTAFDALLSDDVSEVVKKIQDIDMFYDACTTNHIAKRASKAQGSAYLTLATRAFGDKKREKGLREGVLNRYKDLVRVRNMMTDEGTRARRNIIIPRLERPPGICRFALP